MRRHDEGEVAPGVTRLRHHGAMAFQTPRRTADLTRRVRDLLRAEIVAEGFPGGVLPTEEELRAEFDAPRACIRDALTMLQDEGLVARVRGQGTFVTTGWVRHDLREMHGTNGYDEASIWNSRMNTRILDWSDVPATPPVARMLEVPVGTPVLRIDYVARLGDLAIGIATNHLTYPVAARLSPEDMRVDFYALLRRAGVELGESVVQMDGTFADEYDAEVLGIPVGAPILAMEQTIFDPSGRPIDCAFIRTSGRRSTFFSRATRNAGPSVGPTVTEAAAQARSATPAKPGES